MVWPAGEAAFVTGGASGIGLGIARALVAAGAKVAIADLDAAGLSEVAQELTDDGGTVTTVVLDVTDSDAWTEAADQAEKVLGPISVLVNNAGVVGSPMPVEQTPLEVWRWVHAVNIDGQFLGVSTFLPRFKGRGGRAHIVNTASMAGLVPMTAVGSYVSSKYASVGFTTLLREELKDTEVGVTLLTPGTVATRIAHTAVAAEAKLLGHETNTGAADVNNALTGQGADPDRVGEQVVEAIRAGQFLIVTHREWGPLVAGLQDEIQRTFSECDGRHGVDPAASLMAQGTDPVSS